MKTSQKPRIFLFTGIAMNIVSAKQISDYLKISDSTIYNLANKGKIPAFKVGGSWRFDLDEIIKHLHVDAAGAEKVKQSDLIPIKDKLTEFAKILDEKIKNLEPRK